MKKLKNKVYLTIFVILSIFSITLLFIYNYQYYKSEYLRVENSLRNTNILSKRGEVGRGPMRFIDTKVYTVLLDDDKNIINIISHYDEENIDEDLKEFINSIDKNNKETVIGNLYKDKYSYRVHKNGIILVDNSNSISKLNSIKKISIFFLVCMELIAAYISSLLSRWIIRPVVEAFDKQKQFIADASHELKTPLAVIMASADALEKNKSEKKWISNIQTESERMNNLITNLLDLSKVENSKPIFEEVNLSKIVEKVSLTLESLMFEKNIELLTNIDKDIIIKSNSDEMKQLISILLDNAIKHSISDGEITVNLSENKSQILLEVKNKGEAIKKGEEEKIFERFYRSDKSRNRNDNRYGLGLAIAKSIVEKYNGQISAYSENKYTTFKVEFKKK